ncbi:glycan-binding surface protein [Rufibacter sp. XAAS-G3-1]|uniref:glycan-binding surface protein n=1 Tax=Rufibacter sp. XAAS-G3-1 TaxID=2729134 RepID=UPI0015E7A969|nr:glycan-binding surface protein [Rufibacter sp. XAAS-G3-1]
MKIHLKTLLFLFIAVAMAGVFTGCSEDDDLPNGGKPMVSYIRVTRPSSSDSLITKAGQGSMIAIVGQNLQNTREIWFNDQEAFLSPTLITNTTVITRVPSNIPLEISNKMRIIFTNGEELIHDFTVDISEPRIDRMQSEYVNTGDVATIVGDFFYEPLTVTFTGGAQGEIVSISRDYKTLEVTVPAGAQPGPITISSNFGATESDFWFRDNRNVIASFDEPGLLATTSGLWHGPNYIRDNDAAIKPVNGKYLRINQNLAAWAWYETYVGPNNSAAALETKNIPADAFANPGKYSLKFEINTLADLTGAHYRMHMGPGDIASLRGNVFYNWQVNNINTDGTWRTVTLPWEDFWKANGSFAYTPSGYGVSFHFSGPNPVNANFALDNMRVVPTMNP